MSTKSEETGLKYEKIAMEVMGTHCKEDETPWENMIMAKAYFFVGVTVTTSSIAAILLFMYKMTSDGYTGIYHLKLLMLAGLFTLGLSWTISARRFIKTAKVESRM